MGGQTKGTFGSDLCQAEDFMDDKGHFLFQDGVLFLLKGMCVYTKIMVFAANSTDGISTYLDHMI